MHMRLAIVTSLLALLAACGGEAPADGVASARTTTPSATAAPAPSVVASAAPSASASAAPAAAPGGIPADWAPLDLASAGALWKGHTIKAPPGATIKKAFDGPEIVKDEEFGLVVSFTATRLGATKAGYQDAVSYGTRATFLEETNELLEYSLESTDAASKAPKTYGFHMLVKVGKATYGCKTTVSKPSREELTPLKEACKSLTKA